MHGRVGGLSSGRSYYGEMDTIDTSISDCHSPFDDSNDCFSSSDNCFSSSDDW